MSGGSLLKAGRPSNSKSRATLSEMADKGDMVRVNFDLSRDEHIRLKVYAAKSGRRVADILREAIAKLE